MQIACVIYKNPVEKILLKQLKDKMTCKQKDSLL